MRAIPFALAVMLSASACNLYFGSDRTGRGGGGDDTTPDAGPGDVEDGGAPYPDGYVLSDGGIGGGPDAGCGGHDGGVPRGDGGVPRGDGGLGDGGWGTVDAGACCAGGHDGGH